MIGTILLPKKNSSIVLYEYYFIVKATDVVGFLKIWVTIKTILCGKIEMRKHCIAWSKVHRREVETECCVSVKAKVAEFRFLEK